MENNFYFKNKTKVKESAIKLDIKIWKDEVPHLIL